MSKIIYSFYLLTKRKYATCLFDEGVVVFVFCTTRELASKLLLLDMLFDRKSSLSFLLLTEFAVELSLFGANILRGQGYIAEELTSLSDRGNYAS